MTLLGAGADGVGCNRSDRTTAERSVGASSGSGKKLGWALVGLGKFATEQILPAFAKCKRSRVTALVSGSPEKAKKVAQKYGVSSKAIYDYARFDELRHDPDVDVVYVLLPNGKHAEYVIRGAKAGKHVMCEKPMATTLEDARAMIEVCRRESRLLMVAYRARFEPHNVAAIAAVRAGEIGRLKTITAEHVRTLDPTDPADRWRTKRELSGGGSLVDIGIYSLQAARYITGEEPSAVSAILSSPPDDPRFAEVEETASFTLQFPSGVIASCLSSYGSPSVKRYRAFGERGYVDLEPATEYVGNQLRVRREKGAALVRDVPEGDQFALEIDHLSESIANETKVLTPGEEGLRDMKIMHAIYEAAKTGGRVRLDPG